MITSLNVQYPHRLDRLVAVNMLRKKQLSRLTRVQTSSATTSIIYENRTVNARDASTRKQNKLEKRMKHEKKNKTNARVER